MAAESTLGVGERIKAARDSRAWSQEFLADKLGVKRETVNQWEAETRQIKAGDLLRLVDVMEISADYLLGRMEEETQAETDICGATGLTAAAASALIADAEDVFDALFSDGLKKSQTQLSAIGLEALNKLLSCPQGLEALENIALYLRAGEYRFVGGKKSVGVEAGTFTNSAGSITHTFHFTPDMAKSIHRDELLRKLDEMKTRIPQEELDAARAELHNKDKGDDE